MNANILPEYPVAVGQRLEFVLYGTGPKSYDSTNGDVITLPAGFYLDSVQGAYSVSGTYFTRVRPSAVGTTRATQTIDWFVTSTGAEVSNTTDLSGESIQFSAIGGAF